MEIPKEFIGAVIGPGGKIIQSIQADTNTVISIEEVDEKGIVEIAANNKDSIETAIAKIKNIVIIPEIGNTYQAVVKSVMPYGAFVEIMPGKEGLLHISEIDWKHFGSIEETGIKEDDTIMVKLLDIDEKTGKFKLSAKALKEKPEGYVEPEPRERRPRPNRNNKRGNYENKNNNVSE